MMGPAIFVGYALLGLVALRIAFLLGGFRREDIGDIDVLGAMAAVLLLWPLLAFGVSLWWLVHSLAWVATLPPRRERLEKRRARMAARIAELERELQIGGA